MLLPNNPELRTPNSEPRRALTVSRGKNDGAFSVSESNAEALLAYITNQAEHHRKYSFKEKIRELLKSGIALRSMNDTFGIEITYFGHPFRAGLGFGAPPPGENRQPVLSTRVGSCEMLMGA